MTKARAPRDGTVGERQRKQRPRPTPRWLKTSSDLDAVARSRCLLMLSVLSGEIPVTEAIANAKISRATYYHWETRALHAMLTVLNPLASSAPDGSADLSAAMARIGQLEATVRRLQQENRRSQRLLLLTRKSIKGPLNTGRRGRWPTMKVGQGSTPTPLGASLP
jgi:hypothetical protein